MTTERLRTVIVNGGGSAAESVQEDGLALHRSAAYRLKRHQRLSSELEDAMSHRRSQ
jgi:hypothetical protein